MTTTDVLLELRGMRTEQAELAASFARYPNLDSNALNYQRHSGYVDGLTAAIALLRTVQP